MFPVSWLLGDAEIAIGIEAGNTDYLNILENARGCGVGTEDCAD